MAKSNEISYVVKEKLGVISTSEDGKYSLELRIVSWNGGDEKYDIRQWYEKDGEERCGKGIRLTKEELSTLGSLIDKIEDDIF